MGKQIGYEIRVQGHISDSWSSWFEGLTIHHEASGETVLAGALVDEAALYGVLMRIRDLGLPLLELRRVRLDGCERGQKLCEKEENDDV